MKIIFVVLLVAFAHIETVWAHGAHHHENGAPSYNLSVSQINDLYVRSVRPIFQAKCFDCHSDRTVYPPYYKIPGVKWWIDDDIKEAREHIDMSHDFPFGGHGTPLDDLQAMRDVIRNGTMPPWLYRLAHRESRLTDDDRRIILQWIADAEALIPSDPTD